MGVVGLQILGFTCWAHQYVVREVCQQLAEAFGPYGLLQVPPSGRTTPKGYRPPSGKKKRKK